MASDLTRGAAPRIGDGAFGTALAHLAAADEVVDELNVRLPDSVTSLHESYIAAGATAIQTNTFLALELPAARRSTVVRAGIARAREAANRAPLPVDVTLTTAPTAVDEAAAWFELLAAACTECAIGRIICETVTDPSTAQSLLDAWQAQVEAGRIPAHVQLTLSCSVAPSAGRGGWAWLGALRPPSGVRLGLNCCEGADARLRAPLELLAERSGDGLHLAPSAGLPGAVLEPVSWAQRVAALSDGLPTRVVAGCCGTTVAHIAALASVFRTSLATG